MVLELTLSRGNGESTLERNHLLLKKPKRSLATLSITYLEPFVPLYVWHDLFNAYFEAFTEKIRNLKSKKTRCFFEEVP